MSKILLGCIAADFTGATDLASSLAAGGMRVVQIIGVPSQPLAADVDAVVVALKSRTVEPTDAVEQSLRALHWLRQGRPRQIYLKYCSTFDSTPRGNIGPVAEALMEALGCDFTAACPAFPQAGRTVFQGHLFVGQALLHESSMRDHPLTPMRDSNLVRVLQAQARRRVGLMSAPEVEAGAHHLRLRSDELRAEGVSMAVVDAIHDGHLRTLAEAVADWPLVTGGSGLARHLPAAYAKRGWLQPDPHSRALAVVGGRAAVLAGSCSAATRAQVEHWRSAGRYAVQADPLALAADPGAGSSILAQAAGRLRDEPVHGRCNGGPAACRSGAAGTRRRPRRAAGRGLPRVRRERPRGAGRAAPRRRRRGDLGCGGAGHRSGA